MTGVHFDADAYAAALAPPAFTWRGRTYTGRLLSIEEFVALHAARPVGGDDPAADARAFARHAVAAWFPRPWWSPVNRAVRAFLAMPDAAQVAAIQSFSGAQRAAMPMRTTPTATASPPLS